MLELSLVDVVNLKNNPSVAARNEVAEKICDQFNMQKFSDEENTIVTEIFRLLAKDIETSIRRTLSVKLKENDRLPQDIAFLLANDVLDVAQPILEFSPVLSESDLVAIIRSTKDMGKWQAIARRDVITAPVSHELIETKQAEVVQALVTNKNSVISQNDLQNVLQIFNGSNTILSALVERGNLPTKVAERLITLVSGHLEKQLEQKYGIFKHVVKSTLEEVREDRTIEDVSIRSNQQQVADLVEHLFVNKKLTSSIVIRALCKGDLPFFEESLAKLANLPHKDAKARVWNSNPRSFAELYNMAGLPESVLDAVQVVLKFTMEEIQHGTDTKDPTFAGKMIERIMQQGYDRSVNNMQYLIVLIGKKPNIHTIH